MEGPKILAPALRRRLVDLDDGEQVPLRQLVAEYGKHVHPAMAHRAYDRGSGKNKGIFEAVELSGEQKIALGRVACVAGALSRIGAKFTGTRTSIDRRYYLPPEARDVRWGGPTMIQLPGIGDACDHLGRRIAIVKSNKARSWTHDDQLSVQALINLARRAIEAGLVGDLMDTTPVRAPPVAVASSDAPPRPPWLSQRNMD